MANEWLNSKEPLFKVGTIPNRLDRYGLIVAELAANKYAPTGATRQLANSIQSSPVRKIDDGYELDISAYAVGDDGEYAEDQHDATFAHIRLRPPTGAGFADLGEGENLKQKYRSGYNKAMNTGQYEKYKSLYITRAEEEAAGLYWLKYFGEDLTNG